jgi:2-hydroxyacyl-CoA lyase 1
LTAWSLGYQTKYQKMAEMVGGIGLVARTPEELRDATEKGYRAQVPVVINVIINSQSDLPMVSSVQLVVVRSLLTRFQDFSWLDMAPPSQSKPKL